MAGATLQKAGAARTLRIVLVALAVLVLGEVAVRLTADALPEPARWTAPEIAVKEPQVDKLAEHGGASVMLIGSSTMDAAGDASAIRLPAGNRPAYNASTGGASIGMIDVWTRYVAVPKLKPTVALIGIVTRELNANDPEQIQYERDFFASKAVHRLLGSETTRQKVEHDVEDASALFRYRTVLQEPADVFNAFDVPGFNAPQFGDLIAADGQYEPFLSGHYVPTPEGTFRLKARALHDYKISPQKVATLRRLLEFLTRRNIKVALFDMPVSDTYVDAHPNGREDYARGVAAIRAETLRAGAKFIDLGVWPHRLFADGAHVNRAGSQRVTDILTRTVRKLGGP